MGFAGGRRGEHRRGIVLTLIRWCFLVRALGITFSIRDALRIGFLGYLFNLSPAGIAGGDLLKAVMLAREHPGNRANRPLRSSSIAWWGFMSSSWWLRRESS